MSILLKKLTLSFLSFLILFFSVAPGLSVHAEDLNTVSGTWYNQTFKDWYGKVYTPGSESEIFGERYTAAQVQWVIYGLFAFILNSAGNTEVLSCILSNTVDLSQCKDSILELSKLTYTDSESTTATINKNNNLISLIFADRPFSGIGYIKEKLQNYSLVPVAHAQTVGFGFSALSMVQGMWKSFRNIAFGLFVLVAIVFAFMIMFRVKISPQVVISVQSALPKIIIALILVTFSYAIAGFLIDFMYIVIGLISALIAPLIPVTWFQTMQYKATDVFEILTVGPVTQPDLNIPASAGGILGLLGLYLAPLIIILFVGFVLFTVIGVVTAPTGIGPIIAIVFLVIIVIAIVILLWMAIKVIWGLIKAFANILLLTIFAPIQLALGPLVPNFGFGQWIRSYISNLSVFVVTGVLALFAWIFSVMAWSSMFTGSDLTLSSSGTTTSPWPPLLGSGGSGLLLFAGVSFVLFTMIPKANELIQATISGKPFAFGSGIGDVQQTAGWAATGAGIYASRRVQKAQTPEEVRRWQLVQRGAETVESFTKRKN